MTDVDPFRARLQQIVVSMDSNARDRTDADVAAVLDAGVRTTEGLLALLSDRTVAPALRCTSAWLLGRFDDPRAADALLAVVDDPAVELRRQVILELGGLGATGAVEALLRILEADEEAREVAAWALGEIGDQRAQRSLLALVANSSHPPALRGQAAEALAKAGDPAVVAPALIAALDDGEAVVRFWAAFALGQIGDARALPTLDRLTANDHAPVPGYSTVGDEARDAATIIRAR